MLPLSSVEQAEQAFKGFARTRSEIKNARIQVQGLAFVAAVAARYTSEEEGTRQAVACMDESIPTDASVAGQLDPTRLLLANFGAR